ncbi:MAG: hypothetical protein ACO1PW_03915 [Actinomycetota bacterium]
MSLLEAIGDWLQSLASGPNGGPPMPGTGPGAGPGLGPSTGGPGGPGGPGSGGGDGGDDGGGGDGDGGDGGGGGGKKKPPTLKDLAKSAKDAIDELIDIGRESHDILNGDNPTEDEQIIRDAYEDRVDDRATEKAKSKDALDYLLELGVKSTETAVDGAIKIDKYNREKQDTLDDILGSRDRDPGQGDSDSSSDSGDSSDGGDE